MGLMSVSNLHAGYGVNEIIHGIDFVADAREIVTILGPNGCGKSTFIRSLLGYVKMTRGTVRFNGSDISSLSPTARMRLGIGYVPQLANVFRPLTVRENLEMGGYGLRHRKVEAMIARLFELFPVLKARSGQEAGTLSGGERQVLAMARAMMVSPKLIFLDEPSAGLSPVRADEVFGYVQTIAGLGAAVVVIEQDVRRALAVSSRGYVLVTGRVAFHGSATEIVSDDRIHAAYLGGRRATCSP